MGRKRLVHACRIGILVCIVVLMRLQQRSLLATSSSASPDIATSELTPFFPEAVSTRAGDASRSEVLDADGKLARSRASNIAGVRSHHRILGTNKRPARFLGR